MTHGPVMLSLDGIELSPEEREMLRHPATGGVILFTRNFESPQQVHRLITEIHELRSPRLLVAVDQEGGRVQRFREGFTRLPPAGSFARLYEHSPKPAKRAAREIGWLMAAELRAVGVDFSFAPVLDVERGISRVIGDRAFGNDPETVSELALSWSLGAREAGMPSVGKHFPGHGAIAADSHHELPVDQREFEEIEKWDLFPFRRLIANDLEAIMPAHVIYEKVDEKPAGFSSKWIKQILRERMSFSGVIFSDDLSMEAAHVVGSYGDRAEIALDAGCDMVLVCNNPDGAAETLERLATYSDPVSQSRMARMHGRKKYTFDQLKEDSRWHGALEKLALLSEEPSLSLDLAD